MIHPVIIGVSAVHEIRQAKLLEAEAAVMAAVRAENNYQRGTELLGQRTFTTYSELMRKKMVAQSRRTLSSTV